MGAAQVWTQAPSSPRGRASSGVATPGEKDGFDHEKLPLLPLASPSAPSARAPRAASTAPSAPAVGADGGRAAPGRPRTDGAATPRLAAPPRSCDAYQGPLVGPRPTARTRVAAERLGRLLPDLAQATETTLHQRTGWEVDLGALEVAITDRAGLRSALRSTEGLGYVAAFVLSWTTPVWYAPGLDRILVVAPSVRHLSDDRLRFALSCALVAAAIGQVHRDFWDHVARLLIAARVRAHPIEACRGWAQALGLDVAMAVAPKGRPGRMVPLLELLLWPLARLVVAPQRLARRFVPILEQVRRERPEVVDHMFRAPPLCRVLHSPPGPQLLRHDPTPDYQRRDFRRDVNYLRAFNPKAGATSFSAET